MPFRPLQQIPPTIIQLKLPSLSLSLFFYQKNEPLLTLQNVHIYFWLCVVVCFRIQIYRPTNFELHFWNNNSTTQCPHSSNVFSQYNVPYVVKIMIATLQMWAILGFCLQTQHLWLYIDHVAFAAAPCLVSNKVFSSDSLSVSLDSLSTINWAMALVKDWCVPVEPRGKSFQPVICLRDRHITTEIHILL